MPDVLTAEQRRLNMSRVRARNTKPEMLVRRGLHARGLRFQLHRRDLPGKPDLVFPKHRAVILVHGCFWHGHRCPLFKWPATRAAFWKEKIDGNRRRDDAAVMALREKGWRILVVWECAIRGPDRLQADTLVDSCEAFVRHPSKSEAELRGSPR